MIIDRFSDMEPYVDIDVHVHVCPPIGDHVGSHSDIKP